MSEIELLAKTQDEAISKVSGELNIAPEHLEVIEEYEPDELDLKQFAEEQGLAEPPSKDDVTLYVVSVSFSHYLGLAEKWTQGLIERFAPGSSAKAVRFRNIIIVRLEVPEASILIGKRGATLDALQHVVVRALLTQDEHFPDVMLDVEGYREKKLQRLEREAKIAVDKALRTGRKIPMSPMSPAERKFIHNLVKEFGGVKTESRGQDESRHVVVESLNPVPQRGGKPRGGGDRRQGGGGNRGRGNSSSPQRSGNRAPTGITEEVRQRLYGEMQGEEVPSRILGEGGEVRRKPFVPDAPIGDDDEDDGQLKFIDEIER